MPYALSRYLIGQIGPLGPDSLLPVRCRLDGNHISANRLTIAQVVKVELRKVPVQYFNSLVLRNKSLLGSYLPFIKDPGKQCLFPGIGKTRISTINILY